MKTNRAKSGQRGATLVELMISTSIMVLTGSIIYYILNTGLILFAKNTAINSAHQQARTAVLQMEQDLHSAISIPQLTDASRVPLTGAAANGPAAGISFQLFASGPFKVAAPAAAGQKLVQVQVTGTAPVVGQRLCIPTHQIEYDITAVSGGSSTPTLTLSTNLPVAVQTTLAGQPVNVVCFATDRVAYVVQGGQLCYYGRQNNNTFKVMANDITAATPFSIPTTPLGAAYNRFVAAINLSTADDRSSNRNFKSANMFLNAMEPCRARMCIAQ